MYKDSMCGEYLASDGYSVVPCGKCPECKRRRANAWIFRLQQEEKVHKNALFVTLTYDNANLPLTPTKYMTLVKRDFQLFMKRLRKNTGVKTIKYYACGEYGDTTWRPHYHAIIYDTTHDAISKAWTAGHIYIGGVTGASIGYTTKYICKDKRVPMHTKDDRLPEFSLMSKNMGLCYLSTAMVNWHINNAASYIVKEGGYKNPLPRYYRDKIFSDEQRFGLNYINQLKHMENYNRGIGYAGSVKEYYRQQYESVKNIIYLAKRNSKRDKI